MAAIPSRRGARRRFRAWLQSATTVSDLFHHLKRITGDLDRHGSRYALVGGMAISLRTEPRFTRDLDIAIGVDSDADAESLVRNLTAEGYHILAQVEQEAVGRLATLRMAVPDAAGIVVDLLFASCGIEPEIANDAERIEVIPGWTAPVARAEYLLVMKLLAADEQRPQDVIDARALLQIMTQDEINRAREAAQLIVQRGYNRNKNLLAEFDQLLRDHDCRPSKGSA